MKNAHHTLIILILTFATGFSGLVYEVTWQAYLANLIGSHARSAALIVAVFLGGLSLGYSIFGRVSRTRSPGALIKIYGLAEVVIGVWAFLFPQLFTLVAKYSPLLPGLPPLFGDLITALILLAPPTILMGGTLPLLTQALARSLTESAPLHARIYAVNTAGAFFGVISAGFFLLPQLGLPLTVIVMGMVNLIAGVSIVFLARNLECNTAETSNELPAKATQSPLTLRFAVILSVSLISGFISISTQMIVMRLIGFSAGASQYSFSMAVGSFILLLAIGAWRLSSSARTPWELWKNLTLVTIGLLIILFSAPYWPYGAHLIRILLTSVPINFYIFYVVLFICFSLILLCAVGAMGNTLPTLFRLSQTDLGSLGNKVGSLYAFNTIGCVLGALIGGYLALYLVDFFQLLKLLIAANIFITILVLITLEKSRLVLPLCFLGCAAWAVLQMPSWPIERISVGTFRIKTAMPGSFLGADAFYAYFLGDGKILAHKDDPNTTVAVRETANGNLSIYVNGKSDGNTSGSDRITTKLLAHLPLLFRQRPAESVAVIGFGTGITAGTVASYPSVSRVDVIEIAPFIKKFSPLFDRANGSASKNKKIHWQIEDAYRYLTRQGSGKNTYDAIISEPSNPWVSGVERLYAKEFYSIVKNRLNPGGVYAQWFHSYSISRETMALVLNTFHRSWPHTRVFAVDMDLILLGSEAPFDEKVLLGAQQTFNSPVVQQDLKAHGFNSLEKVCATEIQIPEVAFFQSGIQLLEFPKLSYQAGYDFFLDSKAPTTELAEDPRWRGETFTLWSNSLLSQLSHLSSQTSPSLKALAQRICRSENPVVGDQLRSSSKNCQRILIAAAVHDEIPVQSHTGQQLVGILKTISTSSSSPSVTISIAEAARQLALMSEYASPWLSFPSQNISSLASNCFKANSYEALSCRLQVAQILRWQGENKESETVLKTLANEKLTGTLQKSYSSLVESIR